MVPHTAVHVSLDGSTRSAETQPATVVEDLDRLRAAVHTEEDANELLEFEPGSKQAEAIARMASRINAQTQYVGGVVSAPNNWSRHTVVILASGPSLTDDQTAYVRQTDNTRVIAVNTSFRKAPWADVVYAGDHLWWKIHIAEIKKVSRAALWTCDSGSADRWKINRVRAANKEGLGLGAVHMGGNSGYAAINLAFLWGARKIVLLGFDMKPGEGGQKHWHLDHPEPLTQRQLFDEWIHKFKKMAEDLKARGVLVVNCTPDSALPWFPLAALGDTLGGAA